MSEPLLRIEDLKTYFSTPSGVVKAVDGVSLEVDRGETLGIVGESGCGKSVTALSVLQLVPEPAGYIAGGRIFFEGEDLLDRTWGSMRSIRGKRIAMIFQEPMTSLNPVQTVGRQIIEAMTVHGATVAAARRRALELLERVQLENPDRILKMYPHQLSGGMRQRVMIAIALSNSPDLLIADEPTTALDVTVQAEILDLLKELQRDFNMAMLLITHDLGIVSDMAQHVAVMYAGQVVEDARAADLYGAPAHPYTQALFASLPSRALRGCDLAALEGRVPDPHNWPPACRFEARCKKRFEACARVPPMLGEVRPGQKARCLLYEGSWPAGSTRENAPLEKSV